MTAEDARWVQVYLLAQGRHIRDIGDDYFPELVGDDQASVQDVYFSLINQARKMREIDRENRSVYTRALRQVANTTDDLLSTLLVAGDDQDDAGIVQAWRAAHAELQELGSS